jgi:hypothetical protein
LSYLIHVVSRLKEDRSTRFPFLSRARLAPSSLMDVSFSQVEKEKHFTDSRPQRLLKPQRFKSWVKISKSRV